MPSTRSPTHFDVIGDIHGQLGALQRLGRELGYDVAEGWAHPDGRRLVFIGDLVDRGPDSFEVADLVRRLCADDRALCLLGNHELNLIEWRRGRTGPKHSNRPTIEDIEARSAAWAPVLNFFESLPLALELDDLRITHAVWHQRCVAELEGLSAPSSAHPVRPSWAPIVRLHAAYEDGALRPGVPMGPFEDQGEKSLEILVKGHESKAPEPFVDNDGRERDMVRAEWWRTAHGEVPKDRRIVFGHYWNMPPIPGRHDAFVPPYPSGHPKLREWFDAHHADVTPTGRVDVPAAAKAVCIDFNGVTRADGGRPCVGAYRYPEAEVVWACDDGGEGR